jgi:phage terminase small subunit
MAERKLTAKQEAFVAAYLSNGRNGAAAYRAAYNSKASAARVAEEAKKLLKHPLIAPRVAEVVEKAAERTEITAARVLEELGKLGFANMLDYVTVQGDGSAYVDLSALTREQAAAIQEITVDEYMEGRGEFARPVKRTKVKLADKRGALELLGRHLKMFIERHEHSGPNGAPIPVDTTVRAAEVKREVLDLLGLSKDGGKA